MPHSKNRFSFVFIGCCPVFITMKVPFGRAFSSSALMSGLDAICRDLDGSFFDLLIVPTCTVRLPIARDSVSADVLFGAKPPNIINCVLSTMMSAPSNDVQLISAQVGYSRASIYAWHRRYLKEGMLGLMNTKNRKCGKLQPPVDSANTAISSSDEVKQLKDQLYEMQMEIDLLKATIDVLKKDPGVNLERLKNSEKTVVIDAVRAKYALSDLLQQISLPRSNYYLCRAIQRKKDKYQGIKEQIRDIFTENREIYGYRRIKSKMERLGIRVSKKVIRRLMKEMRLTVKQPRRARYSSYKGEITPAAENLIDRDFKAPCPNEKRLTDITEFGLSDGKVYLSPMIDCFDGMPVTWTIGTSPDADLVNTMLDQAIAVLPPDAKPIVHSDRGCHYRWPRWIRRMQDAGLRRSMSKKGCSPDNAACEGFFGHLKNEMFYNHSWQGIGTKQFIPILNDYLIWYREKRIKLSLHGLSPIEYRRKLGLI